MEVSKQWGLARTPAHRELRDAFARGPEQRRSPPRFPMENHRAWLLVSHVGAKSLLRAVI